MSKLNNLIFSFKRKNEHGFTNREIEELIQLYDNINVDKVNNVLVQCNFKVIDGDIVIPFEDVKVAVRCGLENRNRKLYE